MKNGLTAKFTKFIVYNFPKFNFKIIKIIWIQKINWFKFNKHDGGGKDQPLQFHWDKLWWHRGGKDQPQQLHRDAIMDFFTN